MHNLQRKQPSNNLFESNTSLDNLIKLFLFNVITNLIIRTLHYILFYIIQQILYLVFI